MKVRQFTWRSHLAWL